MTSYSPARVAGTFNSNFNLLPRERTELLNNGVPESALDEPSPIRAGYVVFETGDRFHFEQHARRGLLGQAERAFLILASDMHGKPEDVIAWQPQHSRLASWLGRAWAIGSEDAYAPRLGEQGELPVHRDPLGWLRAGRRGIVLLRPRVAARWLDDAGPLLAEDAAHGVELRRDLTRPAPRIIVPAAASRTWRAAA